MKSILGLVIALALTGCASTPQQRQEEARQEAESAKPPFVGMTKDQAIARYGEPKVKTMTDEGEQWTYLLNMGEFIGKHMIPFNFNTDPVRTAVLTFDATGRVKTFRWDAKQED